MKREATPTVPVVVLGGSGYVAGELLRILAGHPAFRVAAVVSERLADEPVEATFPHLRGTTFDGVTFASSAVVEGLLADEPRLGILSALPHGEAAPRIEALLAAAEAAGCAVRVVDLSADFRHRDPGVYAAIYGRPHPAPARLAEFRCALPELANGDAAPHVAHPGCFTTAATLALAPLVAQGWIEPRATVVAVTGSTGAGRTPGATTHHPERRSDLFAYAPLAHRHEPEMRALVAAACAAAGGAGAVAAPEIAFVPCSGPFARGIHATITARLARAASAEQIRESITTFYEGLAPSTASASGAIPSETERLSVRGSGGAGARPGGSHARPFDPATASNTERLPVKGVVSPVAAPAGSRAWPFDAATASNTERLPVKGVVSPDAAPGGSRARSAQLLFSPSMEAFPSLYLPLSLSSSLSETERSLSFVRVLAEPPRLQSVVGTNRCDLAVAVRGDQLIAFSAIDNLVKGAAGGGVQWMNRLFGLPDGAGLALPGLGWL